MNADVIEAARARTRAYLARHGTEAPLATIRARMGAAVDALHRLVEPVPAARAAQPPGDGQWTLHEIVDHLVETHRPSLDELRCLLAGQRPPGPPIAAGLLSRSPLTRPWPWLLREMTRVHADILEALAAAPPGLSTDVRATVVMVFNADDAAGRPVPLHWEDELDWKAYTILLRLHVLDHLGQARAVLAAAGRA
jgi:DinB family protein